MSATTSSQILSAELVRLAARPATKEAAIREAAQMLVAAGRIDPAYVESMMRREAVGRHLPRPRRRHPPRHDRRPRHGAPGRAGDPAGPGRRAWNEGQTVRLVVAIAAQSDAHIDILRRLTRLLQDEAALDALTRATDPREIVAALTDAPLASIPAAAPAVDLARAVRLDLRLSQRPPRASGRPLGRRRPPRPRDAAHPPRRRGRRSAQSRFPAAPRSARRRQVVVSAEGDGAGEALARDEGERSSASPLRRRPTPPRPPRRPPPTPPPGWTPPSPMPSIPGVSASPGLAVGRVHVVRPAEIDRARRPGAADRRRRPAGRRRSSRRNSSSPRSPTTPAAASAPQKPASSRRRPSSSPTPISSPWPAS